MWLGAGYSDGSAKEASIPARRVRDHLGVPLVGAGQESEPAYYRCDPVQRGREKAGQHKPVRGKVGRKVDT